MKIYTKEYPNLTECLKKAETY